MNLAALLGRHLTRYRKKTTPPGLLTPTDLARLMEDAGHPVTRQTVVRHAGPEPLAAMPHGDTLRGYAKVLDHPVGLVAIAALVSAGLAPSWLGSAAYRLFELIDQGCPQDTVLEFLGQLAGASDDVVAVPIDDLSERERAEMCRAALKHLHSVEGDGRKRRRVLPRMRSSRDGHGSTEDHAGAYTER